jgi:alkylated DNA repair dioxygenase AlkB
MTAEQLSFLPPARSSPEGFRYQEDLISAAEEARLVEHMAALPFREFQFHGYLGKRRVVYYGWRYDFTGQRVEQADAIPEFLLPLRDRAAAFVDLQPAALVHALVTEYTPGVAIGWHKDRPAFGDVIGISLLSPCVFRLRRKVGSRFERASFPLAPRSAYLLRGPVRNVWEHSIPGVEELRYSITFRTLSRGAP